MCGKRFKKKKEIAKHMPKKHKHILVHSQRYQDSRHLLQNPTVPNYVIGFSNRAQRFSGYNYLDNIYRKCTRIIPAFMLNLTRIKFGTVAITTSTNTTVTIVIITITLTIIWSHNIFHHIWSQNFSHKILVTKF